MAPTTSLDPIAAGQQITRDNFRVGGAAGMGQPAGPVSFGFRDTAPTYASGQPKGEIQASFARFSSEQMTYQREVLSVWSSIANIRFSEVNPGGYTDNAQILFGNFNTASDLNGFTTRSPSGGRDVWINLFTQNTTPTLGSREFRLLYHETGHILGLQHPGDYDRREESAVSYAQDALYIEDTNQYSLMSYFAATETGARTGANGRNNFPSTPMMHDIVALQRLYGANMTTRTGNDVYGFNGNAGAEYTITDASNPLIFSIWDAGGNDTLDASGSGRAQVLDLRPASFSSIGPLTFNVSIAPNVTIENAIGGSGDDVIRGNTADNRLTGGGGSDQVTGLDGSDLVTGNTGNDTLSGNKGADTLFGGQQADICFGGQDADLVFGNLGDDLLFGNLGDDLMAGGQGSDLLNGGQGADTLNGNLGDDTLVGGLGADHFVFGANSGADRVNGFNQADGDRLGLSGQTYAIGSASDGSALLTLSGGGLVTLVGVAAGSVNAGFFA